jgi:hypothetical protein
VGQFKYGAIHCNVWRAFEYVMIFLFVKYSV